MWLCLSTGDTSQGNNESKASGNASGLKECLIREDTIRVWTIEGTWLDHADHLKGSIGTEKLADMVILGRDTLEVDVHEIHILPTLRTNVGGKIVHNVDPGRIRSDPYFQLEKMNE